MESDAIDAYVYSTKESVLKWADRVESRSGMDCINIRQLTKTASVEEYRKALAEDRAFFCGFINEIETVI